MRQNIAGKLAGLFLESKLTPLLMAAALGVGVWTLATMPSEEEPQIIVPLADLYLPMPGASPEEVQNRVLIPLENVLSGIEGVEYVYSHAQPGFGLVTVRYEVGRDMEESLVLLHSTLMKNADRMPPGLGFPLVKTVSIDDVPFFTATLHGGLDGTGLRSVAEELRVALESVAEVRDVRIVGGSPREVRVELDPERLAAYGIDPLWVADRLRKENTEVQAGAFTHDDQVVHVTAGAFLRSAADVENVVLDARGGALIRVADVATVRDGPAEVTEYAFHAEAGDAWAPMVSIAISKRAGADATAVGEALEAALHDAQGTLLPSDVSVEVSRNYGETARHKVVTLQEHLVMAVLAVGLVILLTMGWRSAVVVMVAVPVTFALTLFVYQLFGYTLNRVTLFALIFVTGIVIDDSIIVAENMERHFSMRDRPLRAAARAAVDEVGNPTILATLTVIAAVLPMLFVSGLMGPYMSPMPIGATVAMLFSLGVALVITPWLAFKLLKGGHAEEQEGEGYVLENTRIYRIYEKIMRPLLARPAAMWGTLAGVGLLLVLSASAFVTRGVTVKMLPFDDKNEVQVILDLPEGTPLETTLALAGDVGRAIGAVPEVADLQMFAGVAAPFNFNGMIRHYYLRQGTNVADLQVNLVDKGDRSARSHDIAKRLRPIVERVVRASGTGAIAKVVEVPPGPPVMSTLVAEIYGDDAGERVRVGAEVMALFEEHPGVVDVDWSLESSHSELRLEVDAAKAALSGIAKERVIGALRLALSGDVVSQLSVPESRTPVPMRVGLSEADRSGPARFSRLQLAAGDGTMVPASELVREREVERAQVIDRKNGRPVLYVMADVAGVAESPVYAILDLEKQLDAIQVAGGAPLGRLFARDPISTERPVMKWDGEWQVTYEVFRDLGIAFAGALVLIYVLIVGWFGSFTTPLVMMAAIPLTLIGIAPGHMIFGAFFTATSMIGMIALAGIMVRNGILLIDYLEARTAAGVPLTDAIVEAGAVRTRPIVLTAGTVVIGAVVILFDPIFQGLAVALIAGAIASTALTLVVVPGIYFLMKRGGTPVDPASVESVDESPSAPTDPTASVPRSPEPTLVGAGA